MGKALILSLAVLAGCTNTTPTRVDNPRQVWCDSNAPRRHSIAAIEAMSRAELDTINSHNEKGKAWCQWDP